MIYLLDVNLLLALALREHEFHERVSRWMAKSMGNHDIKIATCSLTELGFLRVLLQVNWKGLTITEAKHILTEMKKGDGLDWIFLPDDRSASELPRWVRGPQQVTDGHLLGLARAHGGILATLDRAIPGAFVIPAEGFSFRTVSCSGRD